MTALATYLYAVVRPLPPNALGDLTGISGARVRTLDRDGIGCVVSTVSLDEFGEQELAANLNELPWLERVAREHDTVVRAAAQLTTTAPLRMATVCRDDAAALAKLDELGSRATAVLDRLDGRVEWGVKAYATARQAPVPVAASATSGADYLRRRKQESVERQAAVAAATAQAESVYTALAGDSVAGRRHRVQDRQLTGVDEPMLLNAAFLVEHGEAQRFTNALDALAERYAAIRLERTGPWPPYSFASLDPS
jgi:hypothetical protein